MSDAELSFPARDFPAYSNTFNRKFVRLNQITMIKNFWFNFIQQLATGTSICRLQY